MKRFWQNALVTQSGEKFGVQLDGRPVKLPSGKMLAVPGKALAAAIAQEWAAAAQNFTPDDLPLTRLASTAQERVAAHRDDIISQLAGYGMNDLLCYRAEAPESLVSRQSEAWDKWIVWANDKHGFCLLTTIGLMPVNQLPWTRERLLQILGGFNDYELAALGVIVPALGSLILGLALAAGEVSAAEVCAAALLDELWQEAQWGADDEAALRRAKIIEDVAICADFMALCGA